MNVFKELIEEHTVNTIFTVLAVMGPILGLIIGAVLGSARNSANQMALRGFVFGLTGPLIWLLWQGFKALQDRMGFNSFGFVLVMLVVFIITGIILGVVARRIISHEL